jgi:succinate dehydrogenase / fumarate reductase cytochrome b subunit
MKYLMGFSGLVWVGFVMGHMLGNLLLFVSPEAYNEYGHALTSGKLIYVVEAALILSILSHVFMGIRLTLKNRVAKGVRYHAAPKGEKRGSWASQTMIFHGSIILFFVISHLLTFKFGGGGTVTVDGVVMRDLHGMVVEVFSNPLYVGGYIVSLLLLAAHLSHGVGSMLQSFGLNSRAHEKKVKIISIVYALIVGIGFISQPVYVYLAH